jgi:hypothetical protein
MYYVEGERRGRVIPQCCPIPPPAVVVSTPVSAPPIPFVAQFKQRPGEALLSSSSLAIPPGGVIFVPLDPINQTPPTAVWGDGGNIVIPSNGGGTYFFGYNATVSTTDLPVSPILVTVFMDKNGIIIEESVSVITLNLASQLIQVTNTFQVTANPDDELRIGLSADSPGAYLTSPTTSPGLLSMNGFSGQSIKKSGIFVNTQRLY